MKYSILGFNQAKIIEYGVDLTDLLLLNYIVYAQANVKMKHILDNDSQPCVWLQHNHILNDLPILNITEGTLKNRLSKLKKFGLIDSVVVANEQTKGTRTYYKTTSLLNDLIYDSTSLENDVNKLSRHSEMTSNKQVIKRDKQVKNDNTIIITKSEFEFGKAKQSKPNLYSKCIALINAKTADAKTQKLLTDWFNMLLEKYKARGKVLYQNVFKGKLNTLDEYDIKDWNDIIKYNTQRGYEAFYPIKNYNKSESQLDKPWEKNVTNRKRTEQEEADREKWLDEMRAKGVKVDF